MLPLRLPMALWRRLPRPVAVRADLSVLNTGAGVLTCCQAAVPAQRAAARTTAECPVQAVGCGIFGQKACRTILIRVIMETFEECLCRCSGLSMSDVEALKAHMTRMEILKGDTLVRRGGRNTDIYIIVDGIWRASYVNSDGNDITLWFASKGDLLFSSWCFVGNMPSMIALEAMSDGVVYGISRSDAEDFFMSSVEAARIGRRLYEKEIFEIERWLLSSGAPRARERYETLLDEKAELLQHVPLKYIASYLFITPQSLSRIRAEMARGRKKRH